MSKKLLFLYGKGNEELLNRQSALGSYISCLLSILSEAGHEVRINDLSFQQLISQGNAHSVAINPSKKTLARFVPGFMKNYLKDKIKFKQLALLESKIDSNNYSPDIIFEFYNYGSRLGSYFSKKEKCPLVIIYDAPVIEEYEFFNGKKFFLKKEIENRELETLQLANSVIVYSNAVKKFLQKKLKKAESDFVIHQNVDFTRFEFLPLKKVHTKPTIGFIGSFLKWHNVELLLEAYVAIREMGIECKLILIGHGQEIHKIKSRVAGLKYKSDIQLPGFADGETLRDFKKQIDIGVMPGSNWYGAPNKIFEYGAAGMAVVAPNTPTIIDLFSEKELLLFEQDNLESLINALKKLLTDQKLFENIASGLQEKIKRTYSKENTLEVYSSLINKLAN